MVELDDIQGNILAGFNTDFQVLVGLAKSEGSDWKSITHWLAKQANAITSVADVRSQRETIKVIGKTSKLTWLCLAVSERVMSQTQPDVIFLDDAFRRGMMRRAGPVLGDRTSPADWKVGGITSTVDVLLIIGANQEEAAEDRANALQQSAVSAGLSLTYRETAKRLEDKEHFGFRDGISQPLVIGSDVNGDIEAGNFVFGYPKSTGAPPFRLPNDPRSLTKNGSFLVLRRLQQDVERFQNFCRDEVKRLQPQFPSLTAEHLQALLVGRWPKGVVVSLSATSDPGVSEQDNAFDFSNDSDGRKCPFGAHIRKVNPRKGPRDVVDVPRLLRRGIPFGVPFETDPSAERGLLFISFQTSISETFEFITSKWMNSPEKPAPAAGNDLLVGRSATPRSLTLQTSKGPVVVTDRGQNWVSPTGGVYLFAPGKSGLAKFNDPAPLAVSTRLKREWLHVMDFLSSQ